MKTEGIPLEKLSVSQWNARNDLQSGQEDSGIEELARSIQEVGLLAPLTVRANGEEYEVLVGQRRLLACRKLGYSPIPCIVRTGVEDADALTLSLVENVHRADMSPTDKAHALSRLYEKYGTYKRVAEETSWSASTVSKYVHLLELPKEIQNKVSTKSGPAGIDALARLARTFKGRKANQVYDKISGFKPSVQEEIIRQSDGSTRQVDKLVEKAIEGAFDVRRCGGRFGCQMVRQIIDGELSESDFAEMVEVARGLANHDREDEILAEAAREFWRTLARGEIE